MSEINTKKVSEDNEGNLLIKYKEAIDKDVDNLAKKIIVDKKNRNYIPYSSYTLHHVKNEIVSLFTSYGLVVDEPDKIRITLPPPHIEADLTVSVFEFCKSLNKSPAFVAQELADYINSSKDTTYLKSAVSINGYINIVLKKEYIYNQILNSINQLQDNYGCSDVYKNKTVIIDYSSPNIAKPFGVGHLRSTVIGQALANLYQAVGFSVIRDNHLGDWGTQFGALIYAYAHWGNEEIVSANPIEELKNLYVRFNEESKDNPALKDEARKLFSQLEQGDQKLVEMWKKFRDLSLQEFQKTYDRLGVTFDCMLGESYYIENFNELIKDLENKGIAISNEDGAVIVENLDNLPTFLLKKSDGSTLYILRDIITLIHRQKAFDPDVVLYVVGSEQKLNFQQLFALCNKAGYTNKIQLHHVDFGLVLINGGKMSTRKGTLVNLDDVLNQVTLKAKEILIEKGGVDLNDVDRTAEIVGTSAIIYADLKQNRNSNIEFDWDKMLSLESGSSVYLQYTYARISSILSKSNFDQSKLSSNKDFIFEDLSEFRLAFRLAFLPDVLLRSVENNTPHTVSIFLEELTADFNHFYSQISILKTENEDLRHSRLMLINAVAIGIKNALAVLNIPVLTKI